MNLTDLKNSWVDEPEYHKDVHERLIWLVNGIPALKAHRDWVEQNIFGFGERSFHYLWKLLLAELPENPNLLEIGIFRGQTISLWKMLRPDSKVFGVSPLDSTGGHWDSDYEADVRRIHDQFGLDNPIIFKGLSGGKEIIWAAQERMYDLVYLDGGHSYEVVANDFLNYAPLVKVGGYLVIDDCNCEMHMPFGFFQGIEDVTDAKLAWLATNPPFEFCCSVVHISVFKRI